MTPSSPNTGSCQTSWLGLCAARALRAVLEREPTSWLTLRNTPTLASVSGACWPPSISSPQDQVRAFLLNTEAAITQFPLARIWICKRGEERAGLVTILRNCLMSLCSRLRAKDSQPSRHCVPTRLREGDLLFPFCN